MAKHHNVGRDGEDIAARYLEVEGYMIMDRNWRCGHKEIDIVVRNENTIVFVEVKTRCGTEYGNPEDAVNFRKIRRIVNSADAYLRLHSIDLDVRFDIVTVVVENGVFKVEHIKEAFYPPIE